MTRLLIVDDEVNIREVVREYAELNGYEADEASDGLQAVDMAGQKDYDCVILDIMMPKLDGFSVTKKIKETSSIPVIMLSARGEEYDKLYAFELGVDDYVVKPFSPKELMARVKAVLDRTRKQAGRTFRVGGLEIDEGGRTVRIDGKDAVMTPKEIDLLIYMADHANIALSRTRLLEDVWNYDYTGDDRTVDSHIKMLRRNLGPYRDLIVTVRGMGYKLDTRNVPGSENGDAQNK